MHEKDAEGPAGLRKMSFEEKLKCLSQEDKDYLMGYIDRALLAAAGGRSGSVPRKQKRAAGIPSAGDEDSGRLKPDP